MKSILFALLSLWTMGIQAQTTLYCLPGQGADRRLFDSLKVPSQYRLQVIEYGTPGKGMELPEFARQVATAIDTTQPFILLGVSLGGMICSEMAEFLHPQKTILISSAKNSTELPFRYRFQKRIPVYKLVPGRVLCMGAKLMQPVVEPDRRRQKATFKSMLGAKTPLYMKRTVRMIIRWNRKTNTATLYHIHGTNDHTLPYRHIQQPTATIPDGSHMMSLTQADAVSVALAKILEK